MVHYEYLNTSISCWYCKDVRKHSLFSKAATYLKLWIRLTKQILMFRRLENCSVGLSNTLSSSKISELKTFSQPFCIKLDRMAQIINIIITNITERMTSSRQKFLGQHNNLITFLTIQVWIKLWICEFA